MCPRAKSRPQAKSKIEPAKLWILLVGVNQYQDQNNLSSLQYSALDCQGLGEALKEATATFTNKEVIIHHDFVSLSPQLSEVQSSIQHILSSVGTQDTILFYFSGHGILETKTQQVVLCLTDTQTEDLLATGLPLNTLLTQLSSCAASQQLVWLDACHSGGMTLRGTANSLADPSSQLVEVLRHQAAESKGFYALLSCDQTQQSWEFPELGHGVFTYYLMRGLRGEAADAQGIIEADALYQYVYHQTLRYIDKTNQQIRLINQQKSSRGESQLQSEFPLQTPKRIVEGFGKVVLGKRAAGEIDISPRQALVVDGGFKANRTTLALSQILQNAGDFNLRYFPQTNEPWSKVKEAIAACLNAQDEVNTAISTALLYLRGQIETTDTGESWLLLQDDICLSRSWLRKVLQNSQANQQIVILDCPGQAGLGDWIEDLQLATDRGQCLIAANSSLDYPQQFADTVLQTLQSDHHQAGLPIAAWISQLQIALAGTEITPHVWLSGTQGVIELLTAKNGVGENKQPSLDLGICPYMGLQAFDEDSAEYFYGREALVQKLVNQISHQTSLAVVGASGSGKSSAVQAGLMAKLRQGKQIPGSDRWWLGCFRPGSQPIQALAKLLSRSQDRKSQAQSQLQIEGLLYQGVEGFVRWLRTCSESMVVLVIDQFEELFTLAGESERQELIELIIGGVKYAGDRFKLVLTIRADFVASCLENPELAQILQKNSVLVPPYLTEADYRSAIIKPAEHVGLRVESGLVEVLLQDLDRSAGDLPLLQFALQQLWERRYQGKLTLNAYQELGGIKGALERQAQAVYDNLDARSQDCARWIFLNLTQLGEGTEDTRRRVTKSDLIVAKYPTALIDQTLQTLTDAKLLVVNLDSGDNIGQSRSAVHPADDDELFLETMRQEATVEVVHEILIRHWSSLRWWLEENRSRLRSQRQIEQAAILWLQKQKQDDFLLRGVRLAEAEEIFIKYNDELSTTAKEYVASCIDARLAAQREAKKRLRKAQLTATGLGILGLAATVFGVGAYRQQVITQVENINSLTAVAEAELLSNQQLESLITSVKAGKQFKQINGLSKILVGQDNWQETKYKTTATLQQSIYGTQELNRFEGHSQKVNSVNVSDDGKLIATNSDDETVKIWQQNGTLMKTLTKEQAQINPIAITVNSSEQQIINPTYLPTEQAISTASGTYSISGNDDRLVQFQSQADNKLSSYSHPESVSNFSISADEKLLATATIDGRINIWSQDGILQQTLPGHTGEVTDLKFIPDFKKSD
ncbi:MAG: caspase family protein, partial [Cyanobacteria bacterium P01_E01_bin.35]